jgi:hypothetical protein
MIGHSFGFAPRTPSVHDLAAISVAIKVGDEEVTAIGRRDGYAVLFPNGCEICVTDVHFAVPSTNLQRACLVLIDRGVINEMPTLPSDPQWPDLPALDAAEHRAAEAEDRLAKARSALSLALQAGALDSAGSRRIIQELSAA